MAMDEQNRKIQILIVEDEPAISDNITFAVETESMIPIVARTAREARELLQSEQIDLIVLDVGLPDENGFDFCRFLRAKSQVPIIFLTARHEEVDRIVGLELGADDYMTKPFSPRELTARIRAILRRTGDSSTIMSSIKESTSTFVINHGRKEILYKGKPIELARYEFRIMELMIKSPGQVFSRDQLMNYAWEEPDASCDRTVDTHIKTIRAKLRAIDPDSDCLQTRRGWGYCLRLDE